LKVTGQDTIITIIIIIIEMTIEMIVVGIIIKAIIEIIIEMTKTVTGKIDLAIIIETVKRTRQEIIIITTINRFNVKDD
jgi:hypothetical protein